MADGVIDLEKMRARLGKASSFLARTGSSPKPKKFEPSGDDEVDAKQQRIDDMYSKTRKQHTELRSLIKQEQYADKDAIRMLNALLGITLNMMPMAEKAVYKYGNERSVYAWNARFAGARNSQRHSACAGFDAASRPRVRNLCEDAARRSAFDGGGHIPPENEREGNNEAARVGQ